VFEDVNSQMSNILEAEYFGKQTFGVSNY